MLQLVNLSNYSSDEALIEHSGKCLAGFLTKHHLDGLEMMFCGDWNRKIYEQKYLKGAHLRFWPSWIDFWHEDRAELLRQFGSEENIKNWYGGLTREEWLERYRENIRLAVRSGAHYLVFHVGNVRVDELFSWQFHADNREVVQSTVELVNELSDVIPETTALLFENLWWPGLTLRDARQVEFLLEHVQHQNSGIMLDTGHLMNTNQELHSEQEGISYVLTVLKKLGSWQNVIRGIHLHQSLSGAYVKQSLQTATTDYSMQHVMDHVLKIDQHLPFTCHQAREIVEQVQPDYLVHEFMQRSLADWGDKVTKQQQALQLI